MTRPTLLLALLGCACLAQDPWRTFTIFDLEPLYETGLRGINDAGHAVGFTRRVAHQDRGLIVRNGRLEDYQYPGFVQTYFSDINNRGEVVGHAIAHAVWVPFVFRDGVFNPLPPAPNLEIRSAAANNDQGDIVGTCWVLGSTPYSSYSASYLLRNGKYTIIQVPGGSSTVALGINRDTVVGSYRDAADAMRGFVLRNGQFQDLVYPGATLTEANGINERGDIVGQYSITDPGTNQTLDAGAFLYRDGQFTRIKLPRTNSNSLSDINNRGDAVGSYRSRTTYIPEGGTGMIVHLGR